MGSIGDVIASTVYNGRIICIISVAYFRPVETNISVHFLSLKISSALFNKQRNQVQE